MAYAATYEGKDWKAAQGRARKEEKRGIVLEYRADWNRRQEDGVVNSAVNCQEVVRESLVPVRRIVLE